MDNRLESKQGKPKRSTWTISLPHCDLALTFLWKKKEQKRKESVVLLTCHSSACVIRPQEPCRSRDQLLYVTTAPFHCKTNNSAAFKPELLFFFHPIRLNPFSRETTIKAALLFQVCSSMRLHAGVCRLRLTILFDFSLFAKRNKKNPNTASGKKIYILASLKILSFSRYKFCDYHCCREH